MIKYNETYKPLSPEIETNMALVSLSYAHLQAIANVLYDLHRELDKPEAGRLADYPADSVKVLHQDIHNAMVNCFMSLEAVHKARGND